MGKIDSQSKMYFSDSKRFADIFNFWIYNGESVIHPDELREKDPTEIALPGNNAKNSIQKIRDLLKFYTVMQDDKALYLLLGLEIESKTHYAMPARNMLYDAMNYARQMETIAKSHNNDKESKPTSDEFISGFWKDDHLMPVITLVVNISGKPWDGARSLHDMFVVKDPALLEFVPNYRMNLLSPDQIEEGDFGRFKTGIGALLQFIKHKDDKNMDWIRENKRFERVDRQTADLIQTVTGTKMDLNPNEEVVDMCMAWENSMNEARNEGLKEGKKEGKREGVNEEKIETAKRLLAKNAPLEIIQDATELTLDQIKKLTLCAE